MAEASAGYSTRTMISAAMRSYQLTVVDVILFDVGGVLFCDPWESLLLTPERGLADRLGLDRDVVEQVGRELWDQYSTGQAKEEAYWKDFGTMLGIVVPKDLVRELEAELLFPNPLAFKILDSVQSRNIRIGVISDNTSFWYPKQAKTLKLDDYVDAELLFLSYLFRAKKNAREKSLFRIAASRVIPASSMVVDDRQHNIEGAQQHGFQAIRYSLNDGAWGFSTLIRAVGGI